MPKGTPKEQGDQDVLTRTRAEKKTKPPPLYKVLLHNDDYTTQEFVVWVLMEVFLRTELDATRIMLAVHQSGIGVAGIYPHDVAETKVARVAELAAENGMPLLCTMEPE
jgi:ATP-dependent Clp protease adaptor protein ClpS